MPVRDKFLRTKPHLNIGTIGHLGHGKTTLTAAILKFQARNRLAREISYRDIAKGGVFVDETRTITVQSSDVEYESPKRHYIHIDCPGDPKYTKNLFDGLAQMDGAILVVSALDSVMAQTREHIMLARQAGVNYVVVFLNKCDVVDNSEKLDLIECEIRELLNKYKFDGDNTPIIRGAALPVLQDYLNLTWENPIHQLLDAIDRYIPEPVRDVDKPFLMGVANVFSVSGRGTVAKGRIAQGTLKIGDEVELIGIRPTRRTVVTSILMQSKFLDQGQAGDLVTCLLRGINFEEINRDQVLARPGLVTPFTRFQAEVYILKQEEGGRHTPFFSGYRPQFYIGTADVTGCVNFPEGTKMTMPGDNAVINVELVAPIYFDTNMRFAIREGDKTVGVGVITQILG